MAYVHKFELLCFLDKQQKRVALLMAAAFFEGASIGPLIALAIEIDPRQAFIPLLVYFLVEFDNFSLYFWIDIFRL